MIINVSALKTYQTCPQLWEYQYVKGRGPVTEAAPLTSGKLWHKFIERTSQGDGPELVLKELGIVASNAVADLLLKGKQKTADSLRLTWDVMAQAGPFYTDQHVGATVAIETPIMRTLGQLPNGELVQIVGIPDRIRRVNSMLLHSQTRTLSASTPLVPYLRAAERDLHELVYAWLIQGAYPAERYFGSELQILLKAKMFSSRKCKRADTKWHAERSRPECDDCGYAEGDRVVEKLREPEEIMVHKMVPIAAEQVNLALRDVMMIAVEMDNIIKGAYPPLQNRAADLGRFGNSLCPFFGVCSGEEELSDDTLFVTRENRYAEGTPITVVADDEGQDDEEEE